MKVRVALLAAGIIVGCSGDDPAPTDPAVDAPPPVKIAIAFDPVRTQYTENDTTILTATVVDAHGATVESVEVAWSGKGVTRTGERTARFVPSEGPNDIIAVAYSAGVPVASVTTSVVALPYPGEIILWDPEQGSVRIRAPVGAYRIYPTAINTRDEVIVNVKYRNDGPLHAMIWSRTSGFRPLYADSVELVASDINDNGFVTGTLTRSPSDYTSFLWSASAGLSTIEIGGSSSASSISNEGYVAGRTGNSAFVWTPDHDLRLYAGGYWGLTAISVDDRGDILTSIWGRYNEGIDYSWLDPEEPSVWIAGGTTRIDCIYYCMVSQMNENEEVVGVMWMPSGRAFKWTASRGIEILPTGSHESTDAFSINNSGTVAGSVFDRTVGIRAAVWTSSGLKVLKELPGLRSTIARDINDSGLVLVEGR